MTQSETPPSTGLVAGKYQLVQLIGRGGMGSVWEARHASLGTRFAIKFIEAEYSDSQEARSRFDKEARAAATIQSKHAIQIYDHGVTDDGKPYIVMEMLIGEPLDKRIDRLGTLSLQDTARILQQVSRGLARAHERGIIHRDLKPENIFIVKSTEDDDEIAKVLDFGIAKIQGLPGSPGLTSSTKTGAVLGTPFYMSPEQARGLRNVDHRTDVWSLGVIAYKCLTGKLPFDGESVGDLLVKICTAPVPVPSHAVPGLPPAFDAWFMRALEREPDRRFSTVSELSEHLAYAAGIGQRGSLASNPNSPMSGLNTVASSRGATSTPAPHPAATSGQDARGPMFAATSQAPAAGGMTAAPFTSEHAAGVPQPSRWKWVVGAALAGLAVAGLGTGVAVAVKRRDTSSQNSVGITQPPPPVDTSNADPKSGDPKAGDPKPADTTASASGSASAATTLTTLSPPTPTPLAGGNTGGGAGTKSLTGAKTGGGKPVTGAKPADKPPLPPPGPPVTQPPQPQPLPPAPPPAPPAKKPNKNDPGY